MMKSFGGLSQQSLIDIETPLKMRLPNDYREFLTKTNGGVFDQNQTKPIYIESVKEKIYLDVFFGFVKNDNLNIRYWNDKYSDEMFEKTILIGFDLMQGFIVLINDGKNDGIYYWDDAYNFNNSNDENNMYWIANSFQDLLNLIE